MYGALKGDAELEDGLCANRLLLSLEHTAQSTTYTSLAPIMGYKCVRSEGRKEG